MINKLLLAWRNPKNHEWIPVGKLSYCDSKYIFKYTSAAAKSAKEGGFTPFAAMGEFSESYESSELFPLFQNRLLPKSRPEYAAYLDWLNLKEEKFSPLDELARSGGIRVTDNLQLFPVPEKVSGAYSVNFFSHGIRHLAPCYIDRIAHLNPGSRLYLMADLQNNNDSFALTLRTDDPPELVGYVPRFFARDFNELIDINGAKNVYVIVDKINIHAPLQFKLLCKFTTSWPDNFSAFRDDDFKELC